MIKRHFMAFKPLSLGAALAIGLITQPAATQDDPLALAIADAKRHDIEGWAFTQTVRVIAMDEDAVEVVERFDPSKPEGEQVTVISVKPEETADENTAGDYSDMDIPNYADIADLVSGGATLIREDDEVAVYRVDPNEEGHDFRFGEIDIETADIGEDLHGELTVVKGARPYVRDVRFFVDVPHGSIWLAKIRQLDFGFSFAPEGPDSIMLARDFTLDLDLTTLLFINVTVDLNMEYSDFEYVGDVQ